MTASFKFWEPNLVLKLNISTQLCQLYISVLLYLQYKKETCDQVLIIHTRTKDTVPAGPGEGVPA